MTYVDAILHIADFAALLESADFGGASHTPPVVGPDGAALVYVRFTEAQASAWRGTPGVTVLAEAPYGPGSADAVYAAAWADPAAAALYDAICPPGDDGRVMFGCLG